MRYIEAPERLTEHLPDDGPVVFLAGGITGCPDWQAEVRSMLADTALVVCNPRQAAFDVTNPDAGRDQVEWEVAHIKAADITLFWFPDSGSVTQPIALFELGMALAGRARGLRRIAVGADPGYCRRFDVTEQCAHYTPSLCVHDSLARCLHEVRATARRVTEGDAWLAHARKQNHLGRDMPEINASVSTTTPPVHPRVKWATTGAFIGAAALLGALEASRDVNLIAGLPPYLSIPIGALLPAVIAFGGGWLKKNRPT